jgi:hypothetical protein
MIVTNRERIWNDAVVPQLKVLSPHLLGGTEKTTKTLTFRTAGVTVKIRT